MSSLDLTHVQVKIGPGNGLVALGNKPLAEPMLTKIFVAIYMGHRQATMSYASCMLLHLLEIKF